MSHCFAVKGWKDANALPMIQAKIGSKIQAQRLVQHPVQLWISFLLMPGAQSQHWMKRDPHTSRRILQTVAGSFSQLPFELRPNDVCGLPLLPGGELLQLWTEH